MDPVTDGPTYEERYNAARSELEAIFSRYPDVFELRLDMPVIGDYVLVAAADDIADGGLGCIQVMYPIHQWRYRSLGLLDWAKDTIRHGGRDSDP